MSINKRPIKIVLITYSTWNIYNSMGETYSNVFNGLSGEIEFAHVYFDDRRPPLNDICFNYHCVPYYKYVKYGGGAPNSVLRYFVGEETAYYSEWGKMELYQFIDRFNPDLILVGTIWGLFGNRIISDVVKRCNVPVVCWLWDDMIKYYKTYAPLSTRIKMIPSMKLITKMARLCSIIYTISPHMQSEYTALFGNKCLLLNKGYDFSSPPDYPVASGTQIKMVYMGTLCNERDKTLIEVIDVLERLNREGFDMVLEVYSTSERTGDLISKINRTNVSAFKEIVGPEDKMSILRNSDVLLHLEPFSAFKCKIYRLSLSSKIVDYFYAARCIVSIGGMTGTTEYLMDKDAAIVENKKENIYDLFKKLCMDKSIIREYAKKAWDCGKRGHSISTIQKNLCSSLNQLVEKARTIR